MNIKKIIKEEIDDFDWVNEIETPLSWLTDNFGDLKPFVRGDETFYVNNKKEAFFYYNQGEEDSILFIDYEVIWGVLLTYFGLNTEEVEEVTTIWLDKVYGITGHPTLWVGQLREFAYWED
jgi:hypothetical protein